MTVKSISDIYKLELINISFSTALLESCDWDEEELKKVVDNIDKCLNSFSFQSFSIYENAIRDLKVKLSENLNIYQINIVIDMIDSNKAIIQEFINGKSFN